MNANELRLTNWVSSKVHKGLNTEIFSLLSHNKVKLGANPLAIYDVEEIEGIPLSEEWLLKLGFEKENDFKHPNAPMYFINVRGKLTCFLHNLSHGNIKYVHQLQNLYFALTGEELTIHTPARLT